MNLFIKTEYFSKGTIIGLSIIWSAVGLLAFYKKAIDGQAIIIWITITVFLAIVLCKFFDTFGLYINGDRVTYKTFIEKTVDVQKIVAIRITKAVIRTKNDDYIYPDVDLKDNHGNQLYSMIFLREYNPLSVHQSDIGDRSFLDVFGNSVLFRTVYCEDAILALKKLNPQIIVIPSDGGESY